jgi:hypothetical protein
MPLGVLYRPILALARERGVDVDAHLRRAGLTESELLHPSMRLSPDRSRELGRELLLSMADPEAGLRIAERLQLSDFDLLGYVMRHAPHPLGALEQLARYAQLLGDTLDGRIERRRGRVLIALAQTPQGAFVNPADVLPARGRFGLGADDLVVADKGANRVAVFHLPL